MIGSGGSGKTKLILNQFNEYAAGRGFLKHSHAGTTDAQREQQPQPVHMGAILCTRTRDSFSDQVAKYPFLDARPNFPYALWVAAEKHDEYDAIVAAHEQLSRVQPVKLLLIEEIQSMMSNYKPSDPKEVRRLCRALQQFCVAKDVAILGTVPTAKMKRGEYYPKLADRIYGSVTWGQEAESLIGVEESDLHLPFAKRSMRRRVIVQPQDQAREILYADFDSDGRLGLIDVDVPMEEESQTRMELDTRLEGAAAGGTFTRSELDEWGDSLSTPVSPRTVQRWIESRVEIGLLGVRGATRSLVYFKPLPQ